MAKKEGQEAVTEMVDGLGKEAWTIGEKEDKKARDTRLVKAIRAKAKDKGYGLPDSDVTLIQYANKGRGELGWTEKRSTGASKTKGEDGTITADDLLRAVKAAESLNMKPHELLKLIGELKTVGDLTKVSRALAKLEELDKARGK